MKCLVRESCFQCIVIQLSPSKVAPLVLPASIVVTGCVVYFVEISCTPPKVRSDPRSHFGEIVSHICTKDATKF